MNNHDPAEARLNHVIAHLRSMSIPKCPELPPQESTRRPTTFRFPGWKMSMTVAAAAMVVLCAGLIYSSFLRKDIETAGGDFARPRVSDTDTEQAVEPMLPQPVLPVNGLVARSEITLVQLEGSAAKAAMNEQLREVERDLGELARTAALLDARAVVNRLVAQYADTQWIAREEGQNR